jgi:hypothetical protein
MPIHTYRADSVTVPGHPYDRFAAWEGRDCHHQALGAQVRLEVSGVIFFSTHRGGVPAQWSNDAGAARVPSGVAAHQLCHGGERQKSGTMSTELRQHDGQPPNGCLHFSCSPF